MRQWLAPLAVAVVVGPGAQAAGPLAFSAVDADHNGFVTWDEAKRKMTRLAKVHFYKCDPDGDGLIDRGEYPLLAAFYWQNYVMRD